ncbi:MAG: hypothetical protein OXT70_01205 [Chloroflexota bacterium]|nr:hypothetical protein [Chloroflexota bacterium]
MPEPQPLVDALAEFVGELDAAPPGTRAADLTADMPGQSFAAGTPAGPAESRRTGPAGAVCRHCGAMIPPGEPGHRAWVPQINRGVWSCLGCG